MTTPYERFRALARFPQLLNFAAKDEQLPASLRERAVIMAASFPVEAELRDLVARNHRGLPGSTADTLEDAIGWLHEVCACRTSSDELRDRCRRMAWHFPMLEEVRFQRAMAEQRSSLVSRPIGDWLQPSPGCS